jgi:hypothetical protein
MGAHEMGTHDPNHIPGLTHLVYNPRSDLLDKGGGCAIPGPLHSLWQQRTQSGNSYDFPVGAGDVLHVQVADLDEGSVAKLVEK